MMAKEAIGRPFPSFKASDANSDISGNSLKGKVVLINFWFEGCHPCLAEFAALNELYKQLKVEKDFEFISFTFDNAETIKRVKEKYKLQFKVLSVSEDECRRLDQNNGFPTSIILNRSGNITYLVTGSVPDRDASEFVMSNLLFKIKVEL